MHRRSSYASILGVIVLMCGILFGLLPAYAQDSLPKEPIVVNGEKVEYFHEKKMVSGTGNISITYKDVTLTCDHVMVYLDTREAIAEGNVKITQKDATFIGDKINYNFDTRVGTVIGAAISAPPFYGTAAKIDKPSEKEVKLENGYVTTCDLAHPHYRVQARQVEVYLDDKVVAKHIVFFLGNVPVLYFPYYIQPLKEQTAHATVFVGKDNNWGYFALTSFKYYFSDIANGRFHLDYRTQKGLAVGFDNYYKTPSIGNGYIKFYYTHENDALAYRPTSGIETDSQDTDQAESKGRLQVRHKWQVNDDTLMLMELNNVHDQYFMKNYFYQEWEEQGDPDNYITFVTTKQDYMTTFLVRKRINKYYTVVERLPEYRIDIPNYRISKDVPLYYKASASGVYLNKTFQDVAENVSPHQKDLNTIRLDAYNQLTYMLRLFNALNVAPFVGTRQTYYSRNALGRTNVIRGILDAGVENSMKFYKIYNVESNVLGMEIHKLRHIITPMVNYYYSPWPTITPTNLNQFDEIDALTAQNNITLSLENKLQTKRMVGAELRSVDMATFIVSTDYLFRMKQDNVTLKNPRFNGIDFYLETNLYPWLYTLTRAKVDTKREVIESLGTDIVATAPDGRCSLTLGHRYESVDSGKVNRFILDAKYKINDQWSMNAYERLSAVNGVLEEQEYTIARDLHCWIAEITWNVKTHPLEHSFWFALRLKAFPNTPIGLRRSYRMSRPGAYQ